MWSSTIPSMHGVAVFEAKYTKNLEKLESECDTALWQIDDRMYAKGMRMTTIRYSAMAFRF